MMWYCEGDRETVTISIDTILTCMWAMSHHCINSILFSYK